MYVTPRGRLLAWFLTVSKEMTNTIAMLRAVWDRPIGQFTEIEHVNQQTYRFHKFSRNRKLFGLIVGTLRMSIAINMLVCGMFFLAYTIELSRLLLQTVVLSFVMNVDELVFTTLAPLHAKQVRTPRRPHPRPHAAPSLWLSVSPLAHFILVPSILINILDQYSIYSSPQSWSAPHPSPQHSLTPCPRSQPSPDARPSGRRSSRPSSPSQSQRSRGGEPSSPPR